MIYNSIINLKGVQEMNKSIAVKENNSIVASKNIFINRFVKFLDVAPLTVQAYTSGLKQFFTYLASNGIKQPDRNSIIEFKKYLIENNRKNSTIALYLSGLKRFFAFLENEGLYSNITIGVKAPKITRQHKKDAFSGTQIKEVMSTINTNTLEGLRNFAMIGLIATAGLRTIEVTRANIEDLRLNAGQWVLYIQGKGRADKGEFVHVTPKVLKALRAYLKARGNVKATEPLFASCSRRNNGSRLTTRTVSGVCKNAMKAAGYISSRLTAHSLRHTAITLALMAGQSIQEVCSFARHANIATTMIYAHDVSRLNSQCESLIERAIF